MPNMIWLYRRPILDYWAEHEETLGAIITHVLVHEIGHHFGLSDDDMDGDRDEPSNREGDDHESHRRMPLRRHHLEGEADPEKVSICHCTDCQTGTGSAFRVSVPVAGDTFKMTGQADHYVKTTAESGNPRVQAFCPQCGSPIYSTTPGEGQQASTWCASASCASATSSRRSGRTGSARRGRG